jgi:potassium-transporting ATPase KdpC subunit
MKNALRIFLWMTLLTGIIYPLLITGFAQLFMKQKADGDLVYNKDKIVGASLIAQKFESNQYFWGRPSAVDYNPLPSGGSNLGPTSAALKKAVDERKEKIGSSSDIPRELLFASGSGLDPHISVPTAYFQIERIAKSRGVQSQKIKDLVDESTHFDILGNAYVNVLRLNVALDQL